MTPWRGIASSDGSKATPAGQGVPRVSGGSSLERDFKETDIILKVSTVADESAAGD